MERRAGVSPGPGWVGRWGGRGEGLHFLRAACEGWRAAIHPGPGGDSSPGLLSKDTLAGGLRALYSRNLWAPAAPCVSATSP